jgi:hypothetical protein
MARSAARLKMGYYPLLESEGAKPARRPSRWSAKEKNGSITIESVCG